jgi:hypothetical protein
MAAAAPVIGVVMSAISVAQTQAQMSQQKKAVKAQTAQTALARQQDLDQRTLEQRLKEKQLERERRSAVASSRARLGASGVSSTSGSGAAVIGGLNRNYNDALADSRKGYDMTVSGLNLLNDTSSGASGGAVQGLELAKGLIGIGTQVAGILEK